MMDERAKEDLIVSVSQLYQNENALIKWITIENTLKEEGLVVTENPRIQNILTALSELKPDQCKDDILLNFLEFRQLIYDEAVLICNALLRSLIVKDFCDFVGTIRRIYTGFADFPRGEIVKTNELYPVDGDEWSVTIVTIDGQITSFGNKDVFILEELCGPLIYGLAIDLLGVDNMKNIAQMAPPYAPGRNSPATRTPKDDVRANWYCSDIAHIIMCSMVKAANIENWSDSVKHDYILSFFKSLSCGASLRFSNASYTQSKATDCKLNALAHCVKAFVGNQTPPSTIDSGLDLLFQLRSMEVTTDSLAMIAAVLANGGISPFNCKEILSSDAVTGLLNSICYGGLGESSAIFLVEAGAPAVCSETGGMMVVIPGFLGIGLYSPRIECGCSARAFNFVIDLVRTLNLHPFDKLEKQVFYTEPGKSIKKTISFTTDPQWPIFMSATTGDVETIRSYVKNGLTLDTFKDSMDINLLHIAALYGHLELVKFIFCKAPNLLFETDKWNRKPSDYAEKGGQGDVLQHLMLLESATRSSLLEEELDK